MGIYLDTKNSLVGDFSGLSDKFEEIKNMPFPSFVLKNSLEKESPYFIDKLSGFNNVLLIGNGGSVNGAKAYYGSLFPKKTFEFVTTMEPDFLNSMADKYSPEDTLVLAVSKSGTTVGVLESLLFFMGKGYEIVVITDKEGSLYKIAKTRGWHTILHPPVGGRFSAGTASGLVPAYIMGFDVDKIKNGLEIAYKKNSPKIGVQDNPSLQLASTLYLLEKQGIHDVFIPVYSAQLCSFLPIIIQLMHESFGKENKGQSFFGDIAPETQHHTNQRLFGGRKNICGLFIHVLNQKDKTTKIVVPNDIKDVFLKGKKLDLLSLNTYEDALRFEYLGTYNDAVNKNIPVIDIAIERVSEKTVGELMGFWKYVAVYSAILRGLNPYDQPMVEGSKEISFNKRVGM